MTTADLAEQTRLRNLATELNRIDTALLTATKSGTSLPSARTVFGALSDASIACAEVIEIYGAREIPRNVRSGLVEVNCSITDLAATLKVYVRIRAA